MSQRVQLRPVRGRVSAPKKPIYLPTRLMIQTSEGSHVFPWSEIRYCVAMSNYCTIHLADGKKILLSKTLGVLEAALPTREFFRIHQSHLVNLNSIRFTGAGEIELEGNITVPLARSRRKELLKRISEISITL